MKITKKDILRPWKVHKLPAEFKAELPFYVGPAHGRLMIEDYATREEAVAAVDVHNWMLKKLGLKK